MEVLVIVMFKWKLRSGNREIKWQGIIGVSIRELVSSSYQRIT
jgi:hypothetical protein